MEGRINRKKMFDAIHPLVIEAHPLPWRAERMDADSKKHTVLDANGTFIDIQNGRQAEYFIRRVTEKNGVDITEMALDMLLMRAYRHVLNQEGGGTTSTWRVEGYTLVSAAGKIIAELPTTELAELMLTDAHRIYRELLT